MTIDDGHTLGAKIYFYNLSSRRRFDDYLLHRN
jgi:hypothetical protein